MKKYTTPTVEARMAGKELLLAAASEVVVAAKGQRGNVVVWRGDAVKVENDTVSWTMTSEETAALDGVSTVEVTLFVGDKIYKTKDATMRVKPAVWDNGEQ